MLGGVIAEFLAKVGFQTDDSSMSNALSKVKGFGIAVGVAAGTAVAGILAIANKYDELGASSDALRISADHLAELRYAAEEAGSSAEALNASLAGMISTRPYITDTAKALEEARGRMAGMGKAARELYAQRMGIDPALIPMLTADVGALTAEYRSMAGVAGIGAQAAAESARSLLAEITRLKAMAGLVADAVGVALFDKLREGFEGLRRKITENFDRIRATLETFLALVLRVAGSAMAFIGRLIEWVMNLADAFLGLDKSQKIAAAAVVGLLAAWRLLNAGFLATPLGWIVAGLIGLIALIDDFQTYLEGGKSLIDWGPWAGTIEKVWGLLKPLVGLLKGQFVGALTLIGAAVRATVDLIIGLVDIAGNVVKGVVALVTGDWQGAVDAWMAIGETMAGTFLAIWHGLAEGIAGYFGEAGAAFKAAFPDFTAWGERAVAVITGVAAILFQPIAVALGHLSAQVDRFIAFVKAVFSGDLQGAVDAGKAIIVGFADGWIATIKAMIDTLLSLFKPMWAGIEAAFPDFAGWAERSGKAIADSIGSALRWVGDQARKVLDFLPDSVLDAVGLGSAPKIDQPPVTPDLSAPALTPASVSAGPGAASDPEARPVTINQKTEITVTTTGDAMAAGRAVAREQDGAAANAARYMTGAMR
ncbi:hypothetical protein [Rhodospirillum sp. A1_3_36]|uniref:phage tail protein n=1 Tax=Rhodospirillum sp. A1_3_36 TaxID=3391666 RepID=UPI0039A4C586